MARTSRGFTLIELMIVVAIIGILAAIAIPKFSQLITKGHEATTRGNLGSVRSALSVYYSDNEGSFPMDTLNSLTANGRYLQRMPDAEVPQNATNPGHGISLTVAGTSSIFDQGGWLYDNDSTDINWGRLLVACTHSDIQGNIWTTY